MIKLIVGVKGTGKTKQLIELVSQALNTTNGDVVCIEKGDKLRFDVNYRCRLVDTESFGVADAASLYGFVAGILASNHDVTDVFIDSALKICQEDTAAFDEFLKKADVIAEKNDAKLVITASIPAENVTETMKQYI
ncbi:MAG: hypothetical protein ACI3YE_05955 [Candidatus Avispirillum sp.]